VNATSNEDSFAQRQAEAEDLARRLAKADRKLDARAAKRKKKKRFPGGRELVRFFEMRRYIWDRYDGVLPDDAAGHDDLQILLSCAMAAGKSPMAQIKRFASWLDADDAQRACNNVDPGLAFMKADVMAARLGVTYATHQRLRFRTIGAIDVPATERKRRRRQRDNVERKAARAAKRAKLTKRERAIIRMVRDMCGMADLCRKAERSPLFRDLENVPLQVRRIVKKLVDAGRLGWRLEPRRGERRQREYYVWDEHKAKARNC
jgi:hypothetical protein